MSWSNVSWQSYKSPEACSSLPTVHWKSSAGAPVTVKPHHSYIKLQRFPFLVAPFSFYNFFFFSRSTDVGVVKQWFETAFKDKTRRRNVLQERCHLTDSEILLNCKRKNTKSSKMNKDRQYFADNVKYIFNLHIFIHSPRALSMTNCDSEVKKCASLSLTFACANSAYSYFISACVSVCMICWPHWSHDTLVNGETSLAESCCHSCLAWTRRGSKSLERVSDTPSNGTATSSTSTNYFF